MHGTRRLMTRCGLVWAAVALVWTWTTAAAARTELGGPEPAGQASPAPTLVADQAAIARAIDDSIGWFKTKDFETLFRVHAAGPDLFLFHPETTTTITSGAQFKAHAEVWKNPDVVYARHEIKDLRINRSPVEDVAWFSALLDDCVSSKGRVGCWTNARWTGVLEKRQGQWTMVMGHFSFGADPAAAAVTPEQARAYSAQVTNSIAPAGKHPDIERVIRAGLAWAQNKDTALLFGTRAQDENLFIYTPYVGPPVVGFKAFRARAEANWLTDRFTAIGFDIRDLRLHVSSKGTVAWFSALVDDWGHYGGTIDGWKNVRWTGVLEKRQGRWLYVQGHFSYGTDQLKRPGAAK